MGLLAKLFVTKVFNIYRQLHKDEKVKSSVTGIRCQFGTLLKIKGI